MSDASGLIAYEKTANELSDTVDAFIDGVEAEIKTAGANPDVVWPLVLLTVAESGGAGLEKLAGEGIMDRIYGFKEKAMGHLVDKARAGVDWFGNTRVGKAVFDEAGKQTVQKYVGHLKDLAGNLPPWAIGAGAGMLGGALIPGKHRWRNALLGAAVGAGSPYVWRAGKDMIAPKGIPGNEARLDERLADPAQYGRIFDAVLETNTDANGKLDVNKDGIADSRERVFLTNDHGRVRPTVIPYSR